MTYIPDPIERIGSRIDDLAWEWEIAQRDVPTGCYRCPECYKLFNYEPIHLNSRPDSPALCYDCLPEDTKQAYDQFERDLNERRNR